MLTNQLESNEKDLLNRISLARGTSEPVEPTEQAEQETIDKDDDVIASESEQEPIESETEESEEVEEIEQAESQPDETEELFIELDGEEIALSEIKSWKEGNLRQSDYTKKTVELAEQRKALESEQSKLAALQSELASKSATLEAIISESTLSSEQLQELKEDDPEAYIEYQEKMQKRNELLKQTRAPKIDRNEVNNALVKANPDWLSDGKPTEKFNQDMSLVRSYTTEIGYSPQELAGIEQNGGAHHWLTLLDAARGREAIKELAKIKGSAETKRSRKAPLVTKSKGAGNQSHLDRQIEAARKALKQTGSEQDAFKLRKLIKQKANNNGSTS